MAVYCLSRNITFTVPNPIVTKKPSFPYEWFRDNKYEKPPLHIVLSKGSTLEQSRLWVASWFARNEVGVHVLVEFLYHKMASIKEDFITEWNSYTIKVGPKDVSPLAFANVKVQQSSREGPSEFLADPPTKTEEQAFDIAYMILIFGMYRYTAENPRYKIVIRDKVMQVARGKYSRLGHVDFSLLPSQEASIASCHQIPFLASLMDIFLEKCPSSLYKEVRIGTITQRFFGCSNIKNLAFLSEMVGAKEEERGKAGLLWVFTQSVQTETQKMFGHQLDEINTANSYFPYAMGLKLTEKSGYSASSFPNFHVLTHITGVLMGKERSINAVMLPCDLIFDIAANAVIIFLVHKQNVDLNAHSDQVVMALDEKNKKITEITEREERSPSKPHEWLALFKKRKFRFSKKERRILVETIDRIKKTRNGSVGAWVVNSLLSRLNFIQDSSAE